MNTKSRDVAKILMLGSNEMLQWIKKDATVTVLIYCFVNRKKKGKLDYSIMEQVLQILEAMEHKDENQFRRACYLGVFITDRAGMVEVANGVSKRGAVVTQTLP